MRLRALRVQNALAEDRARIARDMHDDLGTRLSVLAMNGAMAETAPGMKGASASARTKPATLSTGLVVQVPEYLATGELIKVNTGTGEYMSRA